MFFRKFLVMFLFHQCAQSSSKEYCFAALLYKKEKLQYTLQSVANKEKKIHLILQMKLMFCYLYGLQRMPFYIKEGLWKSLRSISSWTERRKKILLWWIFYLLLLLLFFFWSSRRVTANENFYKKLFSWPFPFVFFPKPSFLLELGIQRTDAKSFNNLGVEDIFS